MIVHKGFKYRLKPTPQLEYKLKWIGSSLLFADRWFPSSKKCSHCGEVKKELKLSERIFRCGCGFEEDRDVNAALNLRALAVSSTVLACGEEISPKAILA